MARFNKVWAGPFTECKPQVSEGKADAAILPGTFVVRTATGLANADASTTGSILVAQENYLVGKGVNEAYAAGDTALGLTMLKEQLFNVRVPNGADIANGAPLTSDANGKAVLAAAGDFVVATAEEDYSNTTGEDQLVQVRPVSGYIAA